MSVRFTVGGVLWLGLRTWLRGGLRFLAIAIALYVPQFVWYAVQPTDTMRAFQRVMAEQNSLVRELLSGRYLLFALTSAAIAHGAAAVWLGHRPPVGGALKAAMRRCLPLAGIAIVSAALSSLAGSALHALALAGWASWVWVAFNTVVRSLLYLATPIAVIERRGFLASIVRGLALTRGARLRVWAIVVVLQMIASGAVWLLWLVSAPDWGTTAGGRPNGFLIYGAAALAFTLLWTSVAGVINAVTFRVLRDVKEGPPADELATVFE
jgi:hypothetical protein